MWAYWPEPPVCFLCVKSYATVLGGRFAVADLRRADLDLDVVLAANPLDVNLQVQLAHAGDHRLARLFVGHHLERRVFLAEPLQGLAQPIGSCRATAG